MISSSFYITTAISYPNGAPHLGHAYEAIIADMIARFKRLEGWDVFFLTGTDEHGQKMLQTATEKGITPEQLCALNVPLFQKMLTNLSVTHDRFIRTSDPQHRQAVEHFWKVLVRQKAITKGIYKGWYAQQDECFYQKSDLQWQENKTPLAPTGAQVEFLEEECYFFNLSSWEKKLLAFYESHSQWIFPQTRMNEVRRFVEGGLRDLAVSRKDLAWGINVPGDPQQAIYVWLDALINYISALGYPDNDSLFTRHWPCHIHVIGKDIVRFHGTYWPAFLWAADLPLPQKLAVHGHLMIKGEKMSKSLGNILKPQDLIDQYGSDQVRYFLLREVPMGGDGHYSPLQMRKRLNADLAHTLGNLVHRVFTLVHKHCDGRIPAGSLAQDATNEEQKALLVTFYGLPKIMKKHIQDLTLHRYLEEIFLLLGRCNQIFTNEAPWEQATKNSQKMRQTLYIMLEVLRGVAILLQVVLPKGMKTLLTMLNQSASQRRLKHVCHAHALEKGLPLAPLKGPLYPSFR